MKRFNSPASYTLRVNGEERAVVAAAGETLAHVLRRILGLTGTKIGCENGDCGACTVLVDGVPTKSCYTLALDAADAEITTIEGLSDTPVQRAFLAENGFQCGYCTSGFVLNAHALLRKHHQPDPATAREWLESNLCRCTGYEGIARAVDRAAARGSTTTQ